jgi:hypothetical protein
LERPDGKSNRCHPGETGVVQHALACSFI